MLQGNGWRFNHYNLRMIALDPSSASVQSDFALALNEVPTPPAVGAQNLRVGVAWNLVIPPGTDANGDPLTYSVKGLPAGSERARYSRPINQARSIFERHWNAAPAAFIHIRGSSEITQ